MKEKVQKQKFQPRMEKGTDFEIFHYLDNEDFHVNTHCHDFYEFYFFVSGQLSYQIMDAFFTPKPGDVLLVNVNQPHRPLISNPVIPYERIVLRIPPETLDQLSSKQTNLAYCFSRELYGAYHFPPDIENNIRLLLSKLLSIQNGTGFGFGDDLIHKAYLIELFVLVNRYCCDTSLLPLNDSAKKRQLVETIDYYITQNIDRKITIGELANSVYLSKYYFMHNFKNITGVSVNQYITHKRLDHARGLIAGGISITSACQLCGFGDYSSFFRVFKKKFGCSPKEYISVHKTKSTDI